MRNTNVTGAAQLVTINENNVAIKRLVAGTNVTLTQGDSTITINSTGGGGSTPIATSSTVGTVKPGTGLSVAADGTLNATGATTGAITSDSLRNLVIQPYYDTFTTGAGTFTDPLRPLQGMYKTINGNSIFGTAAGQDIVIAGGSGGADALGRYLVQTATNAPANAQVMGVLGTGLVKNTTATGVQSIAVAGTDYLTPTGSAAALTGFPTFNQNTTGTSSNVTGIVSVANGGTGLSTGHILGKGVSLTTPGAAENIMLYFTPTAITITNVQEALVGTTPSVTYVINYGSSRTTATSTIVASHAATSTAGVAATLNTTAIPANSYIWLQSTATSGSVSDFHVTLNYRQ